MECQSFFKGKKRSWLSGFCCYIERLIICLCPFHTRKARQIECAVIIKTYSATEIDAANHYRKRNSMNINGPIIGRIISWFAALLCAVAAILPIRLWLFFGRVMGMATYFLLGKHKDIAIRNLNFAFDNSLSEDEITQLLKKTSK